MKAASCDLTQFLRTRGAPESRAYMTVGVQTARRLLRGRKPFTVFDLKFRRLSSLPVSRAQHYATDFLSSWSEPDKPMSHGPQSMVAACPALAVKARKLWKGY